MMPPEAISLMARIARGLEVTNEQAPCLGALKAISWVAETDLGALSLTAAGQRALAGAGRSFSPKRWPRGRRGRCDAAGTGAGSQARPIAR